MSVGAGAPAVETPSDVAECEEMLALTEAAIDEIVYKVAGEGRIKDVEKARARQGYYNSLARLLKEWRKLKKTRDLEELRDDVDMLKEGDQS